MLRELHVKNLAVLAAAAVEVGEGFNVLTGETGAGKSIVVDSLTLLAGSRAVSELIRTGTDTLSVTGVFAPAGQEWRRVLADAGLDAAATEGAGDELIVRREISHSGRNRVYVNDQPTTLRLLGELAPYLLRIHGQRDELGLVDPELQRVWLDRSGGEAAAALAAELDAAYRRLEELTARAERRAGGERMRQERLDLLRFQLAELAALAPEEGEDETLRSERGILRNREAVLRSLGGAQSELYEDDGAAVDRVSRAGTLLAEAARWVDEAEEWSRELDELEARLGEVAAAVRDRLDGLDADPARLDEVESRLASLERVISKHGVASASELVARRAEMEREAEDLSGEGESGEELTRRLAAAREEYRQAALAMSAGRAAWAEDLTAAIEHELTDLGLAKAELGVELERRPRAGSGIEIEDRDGERGEVDYGPHGVDQVVFTFAPNPGEEPRPLSLIASGGELSRIYLALQLAVRGRDDDADPTLIFDEVDSGIGGAQAAALGRKLRRLGADAQVLAVTHLPQVASYAHRHYRVTKEVRDGRTSTGVDQLSGREREVEIARMLAGETTTELAVTHARELIADAAAADG